VTVKDVMQGAQFSGECTLVPYDQQQSNAAW